MATVRIALEPEAALYPASNPAQFKAVAGTNFPVTSLAFDTTTSESVYFRFPAFDYGSGNWTVTIEWYADTATSGGVVWGVSLAAITANSDSQDIETKAFDTEETVADTHLGTTGQRLHSVALTLTETDSVAAADDVTLKLARKVADGNDTMSGDALVTRVIVEYST